MPFSCGSNRMQLSARRHAQVARQGYLVLGVLAAVGLVSYGLLYIIVMPRVSPGGFVPAAGGSTSGAPAWFGTVLAACILLYAFTFLPVNVLYTIKRYPSNPYALILAGCLLCVSSLIEIFNNLPLVARGVYPAALESIPAEVALYLRQVEAVRYLAYDVAGFSLIYAAAFIYGLLYFRTHRFLSYLILGSIILFAANVPCLWFAPNVAIVLMAISIFALAPIPIVQAKMAMNEA